MELLMANFRSGRMMVGKLPDYQATGPGWAGFFLKTLEINDVI